jgi:hypothetical protein
MVHFLEHLPDAKTAEMVVRSAAQVATDFLFIRHLPYMNRKILTTDEPKDSITSIPRYRFSGDELCVGRIRITAPTL